MLSLILLFSLLGSIGAPLLSALLLIFPKRICFRLLPDLVSYATGTLLGAALNGIPRGKALFLDELASVTTLPGALLAYFWLDSASALILLVLALSSASFIYLALSDLTPGVRKNTV